MKFLLPQKPFFSISAQLLQPYGQSFQCRMLLSIEFGLFSYVVLISNYGVMINKFAW